jgi:hypothetical protein
MEEHPYIVKARELVEFALKQSPDLIQELGGVKSAFAFAFVHLVDRCVFVAREKGQLRAVIVVRCRPEQEIRQRGEAGEPLWRWNERTRDSADALHVAVLIGDGEAGRRAMGRLWNQICNRWPDWPQKRFFAERRAKLVELPKDFLERVAGQKGKHAKKEHAERT